MDNRSKKDGRDRSRVSGSENYEVNYLKEKLGVSSQQVKDAIREVGNDRKKIEEFLRGKGQQRP